MRWPESPEVLRVGDSSPSSVKICFRELDDVFLQTQARIWLGEVLHARFDEKMAISDLLADGELLFQVSKAIWKKLLAEYGDIKYSKSYIYERNASGKSGGRYTPYSNVDVFLKMCQIMGLTGIDLFSPSDVVEKRDIRRVCMCIRSLSKKARLKHLNVPDFDVVTYTIAMPTDMVGGLRRSLERAQYSFSSSMSSKEVNRRNIRGADHFRENDFSSEESEESENCFRLIDFQSPTSVTSLDDSKEEKRDYILASTSPYRVCDTMNSQLTYSPQSCPQCHINSSGSTCCEHWRIVDPTCSPDNHAEVIELDFDYWETSASSIDNTYMEKEKNFLADCKENYGGQIYNSPVPYDDSPTSPTVRFAYMQQGFSRLSENADSVDETGLSGLFAGSWNRTSDKLLLTEKDQSNTSEDLLHSDFSLSKFHEREKLHLNFGVSGIKDSENTVKENRHMKHEIPYADFQENPQTKEQRNGDTIAGVPDMVDTRCRTCNREPLPLVGSGCTEDDDMYSDGYPDQSSRVFDSLVGSFNNYSTYSTGKKSLMTSKRNNIPGTTTVNEPDQAIYTNQLRQNFVAPEYSETNSLFVMNSDVLTATKESNIQLNMGTKFSSGHCFCSSELNSQPDHCQFFAPPVVCSGEERMQKICGKDCSHQDKEQVDLFTEYLGQHQVQAECNLHCSYKYNINNDCGVHYCGQKKIIEDCHFDCSGESKIQEDCSLVNPCQNEINEVWAVDYYGQGRIKEDSTVDCSVQDNLEEDFNAVPVAEDSKVLCEAKMEVPVYFNEDHSDVFGENDRDPGIPREDRMESCYTPELVPSSLESDQPFLNSSMENVNDAKGTTGEYRDCCQSFPDDKHLQELGAKRNENVHSTGNMDEGKPGKYLIDREGRKNKENKKQFLRSLAGGLTLFGAVLFIFQISRRGGKVRMGRSVIPSCQKRQSQEGLQKGKAAMVYPGERLNFQN